MPRPEPLRVGYVVKVYPRYSETFIVSEILAHEAAGLEVDIFALRPPVDAHFQDVISRVRSPLSYLPSGSPKAAAFWEAVHETARQLPATWQVLREADGERAEDVHQALALAREVRRRGIELLHAHFASVAASVARLAAAMAGVPYTFTAHAKDIFHESVDAADLGRKLSDAAAVVTVSDFNHRYLRRSFGAAAAGVRRVYNGLDLQRFAFRSPAERPPRIVAVGRLVEKKGFHDLVEACALLRRRGRPFECIVIGMGPLEEALNDRVRALGLQDVLQLPGPRPQHEVRDAIQGSSVLAAPCVEGDDGNRDGLPTVLLEAMALGTPCVSTDVTGIPEILRHEDTGLAVPQRHPAALADALERLLDDAELRVALAGRARSLMEERFDIHRNAGALRSLFASCVLERRGPALAAG